MDIVFLTEARQPDVSSVGGKGANLVELMGANLPVPVGYVVTAFAYRDYIGHLHTQANPAAVRKQIESTPLPESLVSSINAAHESLARNNKSEIVYAVRSSATAEDSVDASFAGQHDTYYYVKPEQLPQMIQKCWASLWSDAACSYRKSQGIRDDGVNMAVVLQQMVPSEVAGVTFTVNPLTGDTNEIVTECSWGMGAAIVDGRVSPDQYIYDKSTKQLKSTRVADKRFMVPSTITDGTSRLVPVPPLLRRKESLDEHQLDHLMDLIEKVEQHYGVPQDIEWAYADGQFYLLQSRPVTRIGQRVDIIPEGKFVLFKPLAENFTDPLLPLSQDIFRRFPMMEIIQGRVYLDLAYIKPLVPLKLEDHELAQLAYLSDTDFEPKISIPRFLLLGAIGYLNYLIMAVFYYRTDGMPDSFMDSYRALYQKVLDDETISAPDALSRLFFQTGFFAPAGNMVMVANLSAPRYIFLMGLLTRLLKHWLPDLRPDAASYLTSGGEGILSTDMGRRIWLLAQSARQYPDLVQIICENEPRYALQLLQDKPGTSDFLDQINQFLLIHGHRALKEFELNSVRWAEDPTPVIAMTRNYLQSDINPVASEEKVAQARQNFIDEIKSRLQSKFGESLFSPRWRIIQLLQKRAKYFIRLRENSRFFHIMGFYAVRQKILAVEKRLLNKGVLKCQDDIFYLEWAEIQALDSGDTEWLDVEDIIRQRRMEYIRLSKISPAKTFGIEVPARDDIEITDVLQGQGASPGICEGIARVVMDPGTDAELRAGEILVAPYTDPAWTPLFLTASAAVVEVGSYLSHAGTIAREYGMPCVVDAADCTMRIQTGDRVRVDGSLGTVVILDDSQEANS